MQLGAKYQATLEILTEITNSATPADNVINSYMRARKYIGSSDRRFIVENVWQIIRNFMKLSFEAQSEDLKKILLVHLKEQNLAEIFSGEKYCLASLSEQEKAFLQNLNQEQYPNFVEAECPEWIFEQINDVELCKALNQPATADFRINSKNREFILEKLQAEGLEFGATPISQIGIRSEKRIVLNNCLAYKEGEIEVQDESSQIACALFDANNSHKIIDYCCGAGGKSLTLSYLLQNQGKIFVHDISKERLENIKPRMERLNVQNIWFINQVNDCDFDRFIIDAPCSGSGTWRRSPDAKFRLTQKHLDSLNQTQLEILDLAAVRVKNGGQIIYMTCSILKCENEDIITEFLANHSEFKQKNIAEIWDKKFETPYPSTDKFNLRLSPITTNTDGFFISILEKQ